MSLHSSWKYLVSRGASQIHPSAIQGRFYVTILGDVIRCAGNAMRCEVDISPHLDRQRFNAMLILTAQQLHEMGMMCDDGAKGDEWR